MINHNKHSVSDDTLETLTIEERKRHKAIYLLPNAFTTAALFCGFFAITLAVDQRFELSCIFIFCAMILDGMDGRVARLTNTQSAFGEQFDSLADMLSFGAAPAILVYEWQLRHIGLGRLGIVIAFIYCACTAMRLARFNVNVEVIDKRFFQGLPSPSAAALVAGFTWLVEDNRLHVQTEWLPYVTIIMVLIAGVSMITQLPFYSGKAMDIRHTVSFPTLLCITGVMLLVVMNPPLALFGLFLIYLASGYVLGIRRKLAFGRQK